MDSKAGTDKRLVASAKSKFWLPPGLHQFRTRNRRHQNTTNMINPQRKQIKIHEADRYPAAYSGLAAGTSSVRTNNEINSSEHC
jgi:hypothetical protein